MTAPEMVAGSAPMATTRWEGFAGMQLLKFAQIDGATAMVEPAHDGLFLPSSCWR